MLSPVSHLSPRFGSFSVAVAEYRAARLQRCLSELHGLDTVPASLLRARALLRLGDPGASLSVLSGKTTESVRDRAEIALLTAVAHSRLGNEDTVNDLMRDALVYSTSAADIALEAEVSFYRGLIAFGEDDLIGARAACESSLDSASGDQRFSYAGGIVPLAHVVARTQELLALVDAGEGNYRQSILRTRGVLETLDRCSIHDNFQEAFALRNLSILARDFDIIGDARNLAGRIENFAWTSDISRIEFTTTEELGWCSALRGDSVEALRLFRKAGEVASTHPERIQVAVDRALFAREFGHKPMVHEEINYAITLAEAFDWEAAAGDSRLALLALAQAAAPIASVQARETLDRYLGLRSKVESTYAARTDFRARAEEAYTHGLVLRAEGRVTASVERLENAFDTWARIGFDWRAARAALELAELNAGDVFRLAVRRELIQRPTSVFAERARLVA